MKKLKDIQEAISTTAIVKSVGNEIHIYLVGYEDTIKIKKEVLK